MQVSDARHSSFGEKLMMLLSICELRRSFRWVEILLEIENQFEDCFLDRNRRNMNIYPKHSRGSMFVVVCFSLKIGVNKFYNF